MKKPKESLAQGTLFEEDFLLRTLGDLVRVPDVALSELVANAWDAGASEVRITIPSEMREPLIVEDDGCGLTAEQFAERWMTLSYNRQKRLGPWVEFPPERADWRRRAYGRNGQGRHGLLCFGTEYEVETRRNGQANWFLIATASGKEAFVIRDRRSFKSEGHGTRLSAKVLRRLPDPDRIRSVLSARFLHDPRFTSYVNHTSLPLAEHPGLTYQRVLEVKDPASEKIAKVDVLCIEGDAGRAKHQSGVAFWIGQRLVGEPGWVIGNEQIIDGRTRPGRRLTFVEKSEDLFDEVLPDWTGFKSTDLMGEVFKAVAEYSREVLRKTLSARVQETKAQVLDEHRERMHDLEVGDRLEVADVVEAIATANPLLDPAAMSAAVDGVIDAKKQSAPQALIARILQLPTEDIEGLNRLLDEWTVRDALTVLDEIGRRIKIVETLEKLVDDPDVDELHVLHPLIANARWLFGPEFESPMYASNVSLRSAVRKVFKQEVAAEAFPNPRKRIDLLFLPDATIAAVATEDIDVESKMATMRNVLLLELKRGGSTIGRTELGQAEGYIEDLLGCGLVDGGPYVHAFVVGRKLDPKTNPIKRVGEKPEMGRVEGKTFHQLIRTANVRLFHIREQVRDRYHGSGQSLLDKLLQEPAQMSLLGLTQRASTSVPVTTSVGQEGAS